ncbi:citrate lyase holo-[acyl-carrier protein] synthase [Wukongibacter baidiensis]|uniref:citrate lyase holo-[acyl-carrier protein] synthase n=1 Tax=Wukongibacter baidiensis TaxID=1723361 RepID=UPI003D7F31C3
MIDKILMDREKRYYRILELIDEFDLPVLCGKINYPGNDKNTMESKKAFITLRDYLSLEFSEMSVLCEELYGHDGSSILMVLREDPLKAKNMAVFIEERHLLGRIFDIDIYVKDGSSIGRENISKHPRGCIICNGDARICMKDQSHTIKDLLEKINWTISNHKDENIDLI